jgi:hypothetical protein
VSLTDRARQRTLASIPESEIDGPRRRISQLRCLTNPNARSILAE